MGSKKQEKEMDLAEVKAIFNDAKNLEQILILHLKSGACIFYKSYSSKKLDPHLVSNFLSTAFSFGKGISSQDIINVIPIGKNNLLLADGGYIRVALLLKEEPSIIIRKHLRVFIDLIEDTYLKDLEIWKDQLYNFANVRKIVEQFFNPSIILVHRINFAISNVEALINAQYQDIFKVANDLVKDTGRNFFFISMLLKKAMKNTKQRIPEIFNSIKELRWKNIFVPLEISPLDEVRITQSEMNKIKQIISDSTNLNTEEIQKLVKYLADINPAERMIYLYNLSEQEIVSPPIDLNLRDIEIDDDKSARKELIKLKKNAKALRRAKDFLNTIDFSMKAFKIAANWHLIPEFEELEDEVRLAKVEDLKKKLHNIKELAKKAASEGNNVLSSQNYQLAYKIALEIFNLGVVEMIDIIKDLVNKSIHYANQ